jgi:hypothetical protein
LIEKLSAQQFQMKASFLSLQFDPKCFHKLLNESSPKKYIVFIGWHDFSFTLEQIALLPTGTFQYFQHNDSKYEMTIKGLSQKIKFSKLPETFNLSLLAPQ